MNLMTMRLALKEVKLIENLTMFECTMIDRIKINDVDIYNTIKDESDIKIIRRVILDYLIKKGV